MATIDYEWDLEVIDRETGDIYDHRFLEALTPGTYDMQGPDTLDPATQYHALVLVRTVYGDRGYLDRKWAYVKDGQLPEFFEDAYQRQGERVPKQFHEQFAKIKVLNEVAT